MKQNNQKELFVFIRIKLLNNYLRLQEAQKILGIFHNYSQINSIICNNMIVNNF
jgi:hypothetical protein